MADAKRSMRSALGRVRHHGASREGAGHFIAVRASSIALALLVPWFTVSAALSMRDGAYLSAMDFLSQPVNAVGIILLLAIGLYHMSLGMTEVIVDYILKPATKVTLLFLNVAIPLVLAVAAIFAVLLINLGV